MLTLFFLLKRFILIFSMSNPGLVCFSSFWIRFFLTIGSVFGVLQLGLDPDPQPDSLKSIVNDEYNVAQFGS